VRLFVAISIPDQLRDTINSLVSELRPSAPKAKWVRAENLHVTLKFIGNTNEVSLQAIQTALAGVRSTYPVTLKLQGLGFFPSERRPAVLWTGMKASANLTQLAKDIDLKLHTVGFPLDTRPFTPHLTLARFNPPSLPPGLAVIQQKHTATEFGSLSATEFHLIESKLKSGGAEYTTLQSFPFVTQN
jgi:RNA 2',3'-cyclic 3'-phosphodiesterase